MIRALILALSLAGCAAQPTPLPEEHLLSCVYPYWHTAEQIARNHEHCIWIRP